jgi:hypothetical protein
MKTPISTDSYGGFSAGDRFELTDPESGETFVSTVHHASYYADDPESLLWSVVADDGTAWDLFPRDLEDPSFRRIP